MTVLTRSYYKQRQEKYENNKILFVAWMARGNGMGIYLPTEIQLMISNNIFNKKTQKNLSLKNLTKEIRGKITQNKYNINTEVKIESAKEVYDILIENIYIFEKYASHNFTKMVKNKLIEFSKSKKWGEELSEYYWNHLFADEWVSQN